MPATPQALILKASAGSGKTFALAKEFIKLLILDPTEYHQILALTFTNDAKNEMKTRVLGELTKLASGEQTDMLQTILADFAEQKVGLTQDQVVLRSRLALNNLLNDYSRFNVNTLDHFFTQLIRHLARELKLNLGYELDLDNDKALRESIHTLYKTTNPRVKKWLRSFIDSRISEDKGWNIEFNIKTLGKKLFQDSFIDIRDILNKNAEHLEGFVKQLNIQFKSYEASMQKLGQQAMQLLASHKLTISDFRQHTATVFQKLSEGTFDLEASFSATFIKGEWSTKTSDRKDEIETCATSGLNELHSQILELAESEQKQAYIEAKALLPNIYSYGVLSALSDNLWEYRTNNNLLLLSDTAFILHGVISQSDAPFIYEKIGARYKHIMIDEFQDTSTHQWKNILPLVQFSLFNEGSVMLVGDVKQSVYRWRGGDANLLMQQAAADLSEHTPAQKALDTNYRSAKNIVAFNNAFFEAVRHAAPELIEGIDGKSEQLAKAYEDVHQRTQKSFEGYVKVEFFSDEEDAGWKEKAFNATHATIKKAMEDGFQPEDIMVLVRTNKQAGEIAEFLLRNGIHTLTDEALYLEKSPLVQFLVFALRSILAPEDAFVLANLRYFHQLILGQSPSKAVSEKSSSTDVSGISAGLSAYEAIEQLIEQFGLHKKFDPFLQGLQDFCLKQAKKGNSSIASFVEGWQEVNEEENTKPSIILGQAGGAVQIKSIHKAKGLESPVVILPAIEGRLYNTRHIFWPTELPDPYEKWGSLALPHSKKLVDTRFADSYQEESFEIVLEELNALYVAFTRAVERLYIFSKNKEDKNTSQNLLKGILSHPQFELNTHFTNDIFELGTPEPPQNQSGSPDKNTQLALYPVTNPGTKLTPHDVSSLWQKLDSESATAVREGITLHALMAQLTHFQFGKLEKSLKSIMHTMVLKGQLDAAQQSYYISKVVSLFEKHPQLVEWYGSDWEVLTEHKILAGGQAYIPDRVAIKDNKAVVIDYKREQHSDVHVKQIQGYGNLLQQMGYEVIGKYLVYIHELEVVSIE